MKTRITFLVLLVMAATIIGSCSKSATENSVNRLITKQGTQLMKNGKPYHYIGTNMWYASVLGSQGEGGNRERLCHEFDHLKSIGVTNLRILRLPTLQNPTCRVRRECSTTPYSKGSTL